MDFLFEIFIKNQNLLYILIYDNINDYLIEWKNNYDEYIKTEIDEKMRKFTNLLYIIVKSRVNLYLYYKIWLYIFEYLFYKAK